MAHSTIFKEGKPFCPHCGDQLYTPTNDTRVVDYYVHEFDPSYTVFVSKCKKCHKTSERIRHKDGSVGSPEALTVSSVPHETLVAAHMLYMEMTKGEEQHA